MIAPEPRVEVFRRWPIRPLPTDVRCRWPATRKPRMTIAIGMVCTCGVMIAADTRLCLPDGSTQLARKIHVKQTTSGAFALAYACNDLDAARTLREDLFEELERGDITTLREVEEIFRPAMAKWAAAYSHDLPYIDLLLALSLRTPWSEDRNQCGGSALYHCRPPAIMNRKYFLETEPSSYCAIGTGAAITDPIRASLFMGLTNPKECLKQIAYLLYRAKKDLGQYCGGYSTAYFLSEKEHAAFEILPVWLEKAENAGLMLDECLRVACSAIQAGSMEQTENFLRIFRNHIDLLNNYRSLRFLTIFGDEIWEQGIKRSSSQM